MVELGLTLQVQAPVGQEFHSGKSRVAPTLMTQTPQILTLPTAEHGSGPSMSTVGCVCVWRALSPLILLCGVGQSSLARKDPAFVPPGPPRRLDTLAGLWTLGTWDPQCMVTISELCSGKNKNKNKNPQNKGGGAEQKSKQLSGLAGELSLLLGISKESGSATIWIATRTEGPFPLLRRHPENTDWKAEHGSLLG